MTQGLSARLLWLAALFVMVGEVLIYAPSIAGFRRDYLNERMEAAHLASLALTVAPDDMPGEDLARELLRHAKAYGIILHDRDGQRRVLISSTPPRADMIVDIEAANPASLFLDAIFTMTRRHNRVLRVIGPSPGETGVLLEILIDETPLRQAMYAYSGRIIAVSIVICLITAGLLYFSLQWLLVRPMKRLTENMEAFRENPEDPDNVVVPSSRKDELGMAQRELAIMQTGLRAALGQKARLAALGSAMTRINHDLRNMLSTAGLISDRLSASADPEVKRVTPTLVAAIDRAIRLCTHTLDFARNELPPVERECFDLRRLVDDVAGTLDAAQGGKCRVVNAVDPEMAVVADIAQMYRVIDNLVGNALEAGADVVKISAQRDNERIYVDVEDDGPGLSPAARQALFQPFVKSSRKGGTGLGLAIAYEIMRAHGGDIAVTSSDKCGTKFRLALPVPRNTADAA